MLTLDLTRLEVIHTLQVEAALRQLAISPDGRKLYVSVRFDGAGLVLVIQADPVARRIASEIPVGRKPYGLAVSPEGCFVVVTNVDSNDISVIGVREDRLLMTLRDPLARGPFGAAVLGSRAYVTNHLNDSVSVFELGMCP